MLRSLEENVKGVESNNDSYLSEREQYVENYEGEYELEDIKKKK